VLLQNLGKKTMIQKDIWEIFRIFRSENRKNELSSPHLTYMVLWIIKENKIK